MKDINAQALEALRALDCTVVYSYPDGFSRLPAVSYYTVTEKGALWCDNEERIQEGHVQVDVWARIPSECASVSARVNEVMTASGWTREMSMDIPRDKEKIYHTTMRYKKYFSL